MGQIEEERARAQVRPSLERKRNAKNEDLDLPTPQRVKNKQQNRAAKPDKPIGNGKHMNDRQTMDSHENGARTRLRHHLLVPSEYRCGGPWARGKKGYSLVVGRRRKSILGFSLKLF